MQGGPSTDCNGQAPVRHVVKLFEPSGWISGLNFFESPIAFSFSVQ
jgi:hypothetical protein